MSLFVVVVVRHQYTNESMFQPNTSVVGPNNNSQATEAVGPAIRSGRGVTAPGLGTERMSEESGERPVSGGERRREREARRIARRKERKARIFDTTSESESEHDGAVGGVARKRGTIPEAMTKSFSMSDSTSEVDEDEVRRAVEWALRDTPGRKVGGPVTTDLSSDETNGPVVVGANGEVAREGTATNVRCYHSYQCESLACHNLLCLSFSCLNCK